MSLYKFKEEETETRWNSLDDTVSSIINEKNLTKHEWQASFINVYQLVMWSKDDGKAELLEYLKHKLTRYCLNAKSQIMTESERTAFLKTYVKFWIKFSSNLDHLGLLFRQLDVHYFDNSSPAKRIPLEQVLLEIWVNHLYKTFLPYLLDFSADLLNDERNGVIIDIDVLIDLKNSCMRLQRNTEELEEAYVEGLNQYYPPKVTQYIQENGIRSYVTYALNRVEMEEKNIQRYLDHSVTSTIMETVTKHLIDDPMSLLLTEMKDSLREENDESAEGCFRLIKKSSDGVKPVLSTCEEYMQSFGMNFIRDNTKSVTKDPDEYVRSLIELFNWFDGLITRVFGEDPLVLASRDKSFKEVVNNTEIFAMEMPSSKEGATRYLESRCPELLAIHCDRHLRKSPTNKRLTEEEIDKALLDATSVLKYVSNKDIFMRFYRSLLARRLLLGVSADSDMEELTVSRLRDIGMPADQVNQLKQMFLDAKLSADLTAEFKAYCRNNAGKPDLASFDPDIFSIMALNSRVWVLSAEAKLDVSIPTECQDAMTQMKEVYQTKHTGRLLAWQHYLSHGSVTFIGNCGRHEFEATAHQIVLLYAWQNRPSDMFRLDDLSTATGLGVDDLKRTLRSLCQRPKMKSQLILCSPKPTQDSGFTSDTEFRLNLDFSGGKRRRFNLIGRLTLTPGKDNDDEAEEIVNLRRLRTQEGIVKLLKTRKKMNLNEMFSELVIQLQHQFPLTKRSFKETLEWLIENNYINRLDSDINVYTYKA